MKYFVVIWRNKELFLHEIAIVNAFDTMYVWNSIFVFDTNNPESIKSLASIVKSWVVTKLDDVSPKPLLGTNSKEFAMQMKKNWLVRRFKETDLIKSDLEIKQDGTEIIFDEKFFDNHESVFVVTNYQQIAMYEEIDFNKPYSGMQIWMMPSKLTHIYLNIAIAKLWKWIAPVVYDPFAWFGTTCFLANALGYDTFWSDINITQAKKNLPWRSQNKFYTNSKIEFFKHDVNNPFSTYIRWKANVIVSEGWLGPVVQHKHSDSQLYENADKIIELYQAFFDNVLSFSSWTIVAVALPSYKFIENWVDEFFEGYLAEKVDDLWIQKYAYMRSWQLVWRKLLLCKIR